MTLMSSRELNVLVTRFDLSNDPASLRYEVNVGNQTFFTQIIHHSIPTWNSVFFGLSGKEKTPLLLGMLVAWDAMRFMALGGETLTLCDGLAMDEITAQQWRYCFINQFGEWRYRNKFRYRKKYFPLVNQQEGKFTFEEGILPVTSPEECNKWLLANGGGKDSLAGMILLKEAGINFDIYEGYLPMGADWETQRKLLRALRESACGRTSAPISISINDNFYSCNETNFDRNAVRVQHYKTDFAVGHTANYIGYFPLILHHNFKHIWFNIEASADRDMAHWGEEKINHQWCKSSDYQAVSQSLFHHLAVGHHFSGFSSTIRGLHDSMIYAIVSNDEVSLKRSHSCNTIKPWCKKCPKCCFSYLMMTAIKDETFAMETLGTKESLFTNVSNQGNWQALLDERYVAWECVPTHKECLQALVKCIQKGSATSLSGYLENKEVDDRDYTFNEVNWEKTPAVLRRPIINNLRKACEPVYTDAMIIGAGQAGLVMSYLLKEHGINHLVLEREEIGSSWNQRWDSFRLNTPNRTIDLPGKTYQGSDPDGFMTMHEIKSHLQSYAEGFELPVIDHCLVEEVTRAQKNFHIKAAGGEIICKELVIATGEYAKPRVPALLSKLPSSIRVVHSRDYKNPKKVIGDTVLVIGGGQSGAQICEELNQAGKKVYWSLSSRPSNIRRLRGKDFMEWWEIGGVIQKHIDEYPEEIKKDKNALRLLRDMEFPLVSGTGGNGLGHSISLKKLVDDGVTLLDRAIGVANDIISFGNNTHENVMKSVQDTRKQFELLNTIASIYYTGKKEPEWDDSFFIPEEVHGDWDYMHTLNQLNTATEGIQTIICATGYQKDWSWIKINDVFDDVGYPLGEHSVSTVAGLYFLGIFNIPRLSTTCLCNGGRDARDILPIILKRLTN